MESASLSTGRIVRLGFLAVVLGLAACGHDGTGPSGASADITGDWFFSERLGSAALSLVCLDTAEAHVVQSNSTFTLTAQQYGFCLIGVDSIPATGSLDVQGVITGSRVTFGDAECSYTGTVAAGDTAVSGTASCQLTLPSGQVTATGPWHARRADFTPPAVSGTVAPGNVSHGDTLHVTVQGSDNLDLAYVGDSVAYDRAVFANECTTDPPPGRDSASVSGTAAQGAFSHVVPGCTAYVRVFLFARDSAGNRAVDPLPSMAVVLPVSQVSGSIDDSVYTLGDTVRIALTATNSRGLGYVGYRWYNPNPAGQDSVAVAGTSATHTFKLAIPLNAPATQLLVKLFARHRLGWLTESDFLFARTTDAIKLPVQRLALPSTPRDLVYAAASDRVLLVDSTATVREVVLAPLSLGTAYPIAARGASLDVSPGEDSALVALAGQLNVAVVSRSGAATVTVPITPPDQIDIWDVRRLRVAAGGRAMLGVGSGGAGHIVQLTLSDGTQKVRQDWYGYGSFERTGDRSRLLLIDDTSPVGSQLYLAASDTFLPRQSGVVTVYGSAGETSGDDGATKWLVQCQLLTADVAPIRTFTDPTFLFGPSALATDAGSAYCGRSDALLQFDVASGNRVRAIWLPSAPQYLKALPGKRVLVVSGRSLYLVTVP